MKINVKSSLLKDAIKLISRLDEDGYKAWFVGGAVRDSLLGHEARELDIVTDALPLEVKSIFPEAQAVGAAFGVMLVKSGENWFDVATLREEREYLDGRRPSQVKFTLDPKIDVARRDFTINGLLYDPINDELLDYVDGVEYLNQGILRTIGEPCRRFNEDYLRVLRAVRFAANFNLTLEAETEKALQQVAPQVAKLAKERIYNELTKILLGNSPDRAFRLMLKLGILEYVLPEIAAQCGVTQPKQFHPEGDVFEHTMLALKHMVEPDEELAWSVLLHDVGKPDTYFCDADGRERFFRHEQLGANMAHEILLRLRSSRKLADSVAAIILNHMRIGVAPKMRQAKLKKLLAAPTFLTELELHRIDCFSSNGLFDTYNFLLDALSEIDSLELPQPLLVGKQLIELGMTAGPKFKKILDAVREQQLDGNLRTEKEALDYVKTHYLIEDKKISKL